MKLGLQALLIGFGVASITACNQDECDVAGEYWCEENAVMKCEHESATGGWGWDPPNYVVRSKDCGQLGVKCVEDGDDAYCGFPDITCPGDKEISKCVGDLIGICLGDHTYLRFDYEKSCLDQGWHCRDVDTGDGVVCSYIYDPCPTDGEVKCDPANPDVLLECVDSVWAAERCDEGLLCCKTPGGELVCEHPGDMEDNCVDR